MIVQIVTQNGKQIAKRELPASVKQRTPEDKLWLALASLVADKRLQLVVGTLRIRDLNRQTLQHVA